MRFRRSFSTTSRRLRQLCTGVALIAYLLSIWGVPMPSASETSDTSTSFICQGHACGCKSADQCWHNCCCFSAAERLAWADSHRVTIPAALKAALVAESHSHAQCGQTDHVAHDCCSQPADTCCAKEAPSHDAPSKSLPCGQRLAKRSKANSISVRWVLGIEAQKCQGLSTLWVTSGACLPLQICELWQFDDVASGQIELTNDLSPSTALSPLERPPCA